MPVWIHDRPDNHWRGPIFNTERLNSAAGRQELADLAGQYYRVTNEAIRRYDKKHLIFGDRYECNAPIAEEVIRAALPYVDVLSFQHFGTPEQVRNDLIRWHIFSGKPVLYADGCRSVKEKDGSNRHDPVGYRQVLEVLRQVDGCIGMHLCGAYLRNQTRKRGLRDQDEKPDTQAISSITEANQEFIQWAEKRLQP